MWNGITRSIHTFRRHIHWRSRHAVNIGPRCGACTLRLALFGDNFSRSKVNIFDDTLMIEKDI